MSSAMAPIPALRVHAVAVTQGRWCWCTHSWMQSLGCKADGKENWSQPDRNRHAVFFAVLDPPPPLQERTRGGIVLGTRHDGLPARTGKEPARQSKACPPGRAQSSGAPKL